MAQLEFDETVAKQLEVIYRTRDVMRRRALVRDALGAKPGERVLDVGCGPGFYVAELLEQVGPEGSVVGLDGAATMLPIAAKRSEGHDNVEFHEADATSLPVEDASFDAALSVQVLEYVPDATKALGEIHRALRPGGRAVIWDVDWATLSWYSEDPRRMQRMLTAWDKHLTHPSLPQTLSTRLREAGFEEIGVEGHVFATADLDPETYGGAFTSFIAKYATDQGGLGQAEADAWLAEQQELGGRGEFFFSVVQFCFTATRPA